MDYYHRFMDRFPDLESLAEADIETVLKVWQGLGYYSRARNMHAAAGQILRVHGGRFPATFEELQKLKGIGPYTAAAIASIAFSEPRAVVDGNVHRVIARLFGLFESRGMTGTGGISRYAQDLLDVSDPGLHNQAIMEFGALACTPANPSCQTCPLREHCTAYRKGLVEELPVREEPVKQRHRYFHYFIIRSGEGILVRQRTGRDIWQHLFEFPLIETPRPASPERLMGSPAWEQFFGNRKTSLVKISGPIRHTLTHQVIHAKFYHVDGFLPGLLAGRSFREVTLAELGQLPVSKLIESYLNRLID
jgi:A/G-specific adenine glycosylase